MKIRRRVRPLYVAASLFLLGLGLRPAAAQLLGPEFEVNTYTTGSQTSPAIAADGSGRFVVVWQSDGQDGSVEGVFGQRFGSAGSKVGSEFQANSYTTQRQGYSAVAADGSGNFVVVWESSAGQDGLDEGVFGQRFSSTGSKVGSEFQVNTYTTDRQRSAALAMDGSGNFVVVWQSYVQDGSSYGVFGQRYDSVGSPVGSEFQANAYTTNSQKAPAVAADGSGNFVVAWESRDLGSADYDIVGQRFDSAGSKVGSEFVVNTYTTGYQITPAVAKDGSGNFVVAWKGYDGSSSGVFGQRFDPAGSKVGSEFQVNAYTTYSQEDPAVAADGSGNFVVTWTSYAQDGSDYGAFGRRYDSGGTPAGSEFQVNAYTTYSQKGAAAAVDGFGNFIVAWRSSGQDGDFYGVFGRRTSIFSDDFEAGDICAWSAAVGSGDLCPP